MTAEQRLHRTSHWCLFRPFLRRKMPRRPAEIADFGIVLPPDVKEQTRHSAALESFFARACKGLPRETTLGSRLSSH